MLLVAATLALVVPPLQTAEAFFPLKPGMRMTYEEKSLLNSQTVDQVSEAAEIGGVATIPVVTSQNGRTMNTTYYHVTKDGVDIVAYSVDSPLPVPLPILRIPTKGKLTWTFDGPASALAQAEPLSMRCSSEFKGEREVMGAKHKILEVTIVAKMGGGAASEQVTQTAIYAESIGLVELTSVTRVAKKEAKSQLRLTKIEGPKEGS